MHINYQGEIDEIKKLLEKSFDNPSTIITILKDITDASRVNLLFYNKDEKLFYDYQRDTSISVRFLEDGTKSLIGEAYRSKKPYFCSYIPFDTKYNVALDNPFLVKVTSQIIVPIVSDEVVIGFVRFSRKKHTFDHIVLEKILALKKIFKRLFLTPQDQLDQEISEEFFSMKKAEVYNSMNVIQKEFRKLNKKTNNPEIQRMIRKATKQIDAINTYIHTESVDTPLNLDRESTDMRVLIADDVKMNVKILNAMIKQEKVNDIDFAYDGLEALAKIAQAEKNNNSIQILFLDHHMPGKLGLEVAKTIREQEKTHNKSKIFLVSITNDPKAIEADKNLYDYHIPKPFMKSDISSIIKEIQQLHDNVA